MNNAYKQKACYMKWVKKLFKKKEKVSNIAIRLSMRAIIRWEQLNHKAFETLDYENEDEVIALFYTCTLSENEKQSLVEFKANLTKEVATYMVRQFEKYTSFITQFQEKSKAKSEKQEEIAPSTSNYVKDAVAKLVMNGLDAHFAMNELELCDLQIFLSALENETKEKMEEQRHNLFWMLRPNLSDKVKSPQDLYSFSWEEKAKTTVSQKQWDDAENLLKKMKRD